MILIASQLTKVDSYYSNKALKKQTNCQKCLQIWRSCAVWLLMIQGYRFALEASNVFYLHFFLSTLKMVPWEDSNAID